MKYITKVTESKEQAVQSVIDSCSQGNDLIFTDYRGLTVEQITNLRSDIAKYNAKYRVVKNRYAKIAFKKLEILLDDDLLTGPTAIAIVPRDPNIIAKDLFVLTKSTTLKVKGGYLDGKFLQASEMEAFSKLPSRAELLARLLATANAPVQNLVYAMNGVATKLVRVMQAYADTLQG